MIYCMQIEFIYIKKALTKGFYNIFIYKQRIYLFIKFTKNFVVYKQMHFKLLLIVFFMYTNYGVILS